jgi:hypothetical protein
MARFHLFPHDRKPTLAELLGSSQAERQVWRKHTMRIVRDPLSPLTTTAPWAPHRTGSISEPRKLARFLSRLLG